MRRKEREVTDFNTIVDFIDEVRIVRLGLYDKNEIDFPYIVPMNFGYKIVDGEIKLYIHGARAGRRWELFKQNDLCSVEIDIDDGLELVPSHKDITERYRCVMAKARVRLLEGDELVKGIECCVERLPECNGFEWDRNAVKYVAVWELTLFDITAKWNKKNSGAD